MAEPIFKELIFTCKECGKDFVFSAREQQIAYNNGWKKPKYCKSCRPIIRVRRERNEDLFYKKRYDGAGATMHRDRVEARQTKAKEVNLHVGNSDNRYK